MLGTVSQARIHHNRPMNATDSPSLAAMRSILLQENPPSPCDFARDSALSPMHPHSFCSMFVASTLLFSARERVFSLLSSISDARGIFCGGSKRREGAAPLIAASLFVNPLRFAHHAHTEDLSRLRNEILSFYERDICCKSRIGRFREHRIVSPRYSFHLAHLYIHNLAFVFLCFGAFRCVSVLPDAGGIFYGRTVCAYAWERVVG